MSDEKTSAEAAPQTAQEPVVDNVAAEAGQDAVEDEQEAPQQVPPIVVHLPKPTNSRTLPKTTGEESFSKLTLYSQSVETVQELKIAVGDWLGGYWLGPYSLRLPGSQADVLSTAKDGAEIRAGEKLSEWLEVGDVFAHLPEGEGERELEVVNEAYTDTTARQAVVRLLEYIEPYGTTAHHLTTSLGLSPGATIFETVRDAGVESEAKDGAKNGKKDKKEGEQETQESQPNAFSDWQAEWTSVPLSKLPVSQPPLDVQPCLRAIQLSPFNPPPPPLRQRGHQLYLQVGLLEGDVYTLVCTSRGWYVSKSNVNNFDPAPRPGPDGSIPAPTHSLIDLLHSLSPLFSERIFAMPSLSLAAPARDPLSTTAIPQAEPAYPWIVSPPKQAAVSEILRTQLAYLHSGATVPDALDSSRDWNEEIQGIRELAHSTMQERVFRERMAQKTWAEFTQASLRAVMAVARGDVIALNPNEPARSHMWLTSNIFVTKAIDSIDAYAHIGGDAAAHVSHAKDAAGVRLLNRLDIDGAYLLGHTIVDWQGDRWVCQSVLPGIFSRREPAAEAGEKEEGDKKEEWVKVEGAEEQPEASANPLIIYGVDSEQTATLHWDEPTHKVMEKIALQQRLAPHKVASGGAEHEFYASSEVKGLRGSDGRRYLLDLPRLNPVDVEWLEKDYKGKFAGADKEVDAPVYPHRMSLLRPELVELFWESELKRWARDMATEKAAAEAKKVEGEEAEEKDSEAKGEEKTDEPKESTIDPASIASLKDFELRFNPDAFVDSLPEDGEEGFAPAKYADESDASIKAVRDASVFLRSIAIPTFAVDALTGNVSGVMDGISLTRHMHSRGINMRYLGHVVATIDQFSKSPEGEAREAAGNLGALKSIVLQEMVYRASKHVLRRLVRNLLPEHVPCAVSHFLNCLIGTELNASPKAVFERCEVDPSEPPAYVALTPEALRKELIAEIETRFRWQLDEAYLKSGVRRPQLLRELASRFAFQVLQRDYAFDASTEVAPSSVEDKPTGAKDKKAKKTKAVAPVKRTTTFEPADILTLIPVIRSTAPSVTIAEEIFEAGRSTINRGQMEMGLDFMLEGIQLYESIHMVIHPEVAAAYNQYASTLQQLARIKIQQLAAQENPDPEQPLGLDIATGLRLQRQAVIIAERTLGVYHPDTLAYYFQLAMLENLEGNSLASLRYFRHILHLWDVIYGTEHPDTNNILTNAGVVLQSMNENALALTLLEQTAARQVKQFGDKTVQYASVLQQLTQVYFITGDYVKALESSTAAYEIFKERFGEENAQTKESGKNAELLQRVVENAEREKTQQEQMRQQHLERMNTAQTQPRGATGPKRTLAANGRPTPAQVQEALAAITEAAKSGGVPAALVAAQARGLSVSEEMKEAAKAVEAEKANAGVKVNGASADPTIGARGHLDVDELVKYIQGNTPSKPARGAKNSLRGKRRTGAKR